MDARDSFEGLVRGMIERDNWRYVWEGWIQEIVESDG
jgi:hypothetical protein